MADYNTEFGEAVRKALGTRSYRDIGGKAKLSASYIGDMVRGRVPSYEVIVAFAKATGVSARELLVAAGKNTVTAEDAHSADPEAISLVMGAGLRELAERFNAPHLTIRRFGGWAGIKTVEEARAVLAELEEDIQAELAEMAREQGKGGA